MGLFDTIGAAIKSVVDAVVDAIKSLLGATADAEQDFDPNKEVADPAQPCGPPAPPPEEAKIVSVQFLHGDDNTELGRAANHWVNLPRDAKWVDGTHVTNIDRLTQKTRIKVRFDKEGAHAFKLKYEIGADNAAYSDAEEGRNGNFKYEEAEKPYTTEADGTKIIPTDFFVTAAGKDEYTLAATDNKGNKVASHKLETWRLVYYQELKMTGVSAAANLTTVETEYAKHGIKLVGLPSVAMDHMPNIGTTAPNDSDGFKTKARTAYAGSGAPAKEPYVVAIGYTDHLAVKDAAQVVTKAGVAVGTGKPDVEIPIVDSGGNNKYLWKNLVPGEGWFVSCKFLKDGGTPGTDEVTIAEADCVADPVSVGKPDMCRKVKVKVSGLDTNTGTITLTVNWVNRMRGGLSFPGGNLICVCTKAWWTVETSASQNQVVVHELGHKVGMVADGTGKAPDKPAKHYTGKGHIGPHCHTGLAVKASYSSDTGTCVMFGATHARTAFCGDCAPAVRKMDLSDGWSAF